MARAAVVAMRCADEHVPATAAALRALVDDGWNVVLVTAGEGSDGDDAALAIGATRAGRFAVPVTAHTLVDPTDPAFAHPGGAIDPEPLAVIEAEGIATLLRSGFPVVVPAHIPVVPSPDGPRGSGGVPRDHYNPIVAALDGSAVARRLAGDLGALALVFLVDDREEHGLADSPSGGEIGVEEAERWLAGDPPLAAELRAAVRFLRAGGEVAVITTPAHAATALAGAGEGDDTPPRLRIHRELAQPRPSEDVPLLAAGWN